MRSWLIILSSLSLFAQDVVLDRRQVPAKGVQKVKVDVALAGRYSFSCHSEQGVELELVDRMAGVVSRDGTAGSKDGRIDVMLDQGTYLLRAVCHEKASGDVALEAFEFQEPETQNLTRYAVKTDTLNDLQARRYWIDIPRQEPFQLELFGRHLQDAFLVLNGGWVLDIAKTRQTFSAVPGKPMTYLEIHGQLAAGRYQLVVYGGPSAKWTSNDESRPLHLRLDVSKLAVSGRRSFRVSAFGRDSFLLPKQAQFIELSRQEKKNARLHRAPFNQFNSRHNYERTTEINSDSRFALCQDSYSFSSDWQWVFVEAEPGAEVELVFLQNQQLYRLDSEVGNYFVSVHQSKMGDDALDVTAILTHPKQETPVRMQVLEASSSQSIARRTNLHGESSLFMHIKTDGQYAIRIIEDLGGTFEFAIEPALLERSDATPRPVYRRPGDQVNLIAGLYKLTLRPLLKGPISFVFTSTHHQLSLEKYEINEGRLTHLTWTDVSLPKSERWYSLWVPERSGVVIGSDIRPLPLQLTNAIAIPLQPAESVNLNVGFGHTSWINFEEETVKVQLNGLEIGTRQKTNARNYDMMVENISDHAVIADLDSESAPGWSVDAVPPEFGLDLARLKNDRPLYRDFKRGESQYFVLEVQDPALYRLETTGRLATQLSLRTRVQTKLFLQSQNGIGRNALIQQYLRPGEYLVTVQVLGKSQGRLGVHLKREELTEGEPLLIDIPQKHALVPDAAVSLPFTIDHRAEYKFFGLGLGKTFSFRIEDQDQWPIVANQKSANTRLRLEAGAYKLISLPEAIESRRILGYSQVMDEARLEGKGPHVISFNQTVAHMWRKGEADVFNIDAPADLRATIQLERGMRMEVKGEGLNQSVLGGQEQEINLAEGKYQLQVSRAEEDDLFSYQFSVKSQLLALGVPVDVRRFPAELEMAIGRQSQVKLTSMGAVDVQVEVYDASGRLVAEQDDANNDWNIDLNLSLEPGRYRVKVKSQGRTTGTAHFRLQPRLVKRWPAATLPLTEKEAGVEGTVVIPITTTGAGEVIRVSGCPGRLSVHAGGKELGSGEKQLDWLAYEQQYEVWCVCETDDEIMLTGQSVIPDALTVDKKRRFSAGVYKFDSNSTETLSSTSSIWRASRDNPVFRESTALDMSQKQIWVINAKEFELSPLTLGRFPLESRDWGDLYRVEAGVAANENALIQLSSPQGLLSANYGLADVFDWSQLAETSKGILLPHKVGRHLTFISSKPNAPLGRVDFEVHNFKALEVKDVVDRLDLKTGTVATMSWSEPKGFMLTGPAGLVFDALSADGSSSFHAFEQSSVWHSTSMIKQIRIWNTTDKNISFEITAVDPVMPVSEQNLRGGLEGYWNGPGVLAISLPSGSDSPQLKMLCDGERGMVLTAKGKRVSVTELQAGQHLNGILHIPENAGWYLVWEQYGEMNGLFPNELTAMAQAKLGDNPVVSGINAWRFQADQPGLLAIRSEVASVLSVYRDDKALAIDHGLTPVILHLADKAEYVIRQRTRRGQVGGTVNIRNEPLWPLGDGLSESRWLKPGEVHAYVLTIEEESNIGVGVVTRSGEAQIKIFDNQQRLLAEGPLAIEMMEPGDYYIVVLADEEPVDYQVTVQGRATRIEIPDEILKGFGEGETR